MDVVNNSIYNKDSGPADVKVVVLHHTAGRFHSDYATLWGTAPVSIHVYITKQGRIYLGVPFGRAAWHCGLSNWEGYTNINDFSIGIELENLGDSVDPYSDAQLEALDYVLVALIRPLYGLLPITRHRDISLEGKIDPSNNFPWHNYMGGIEQVTKRTTFSLEKKEEEDMSAFPGQAVVMPDGSVRVFAFYDYGDSNTGLFCFDSTEGYKAKQVWSSGKGNFDMARMLPIDRK